MSLTITSLPETKRLSVYSYRGSGTGWKTVEIQIRTKQMHEDAELGVARTGNIKRARQLAAHVRDMKTDCLAA